MEIAVKEYKGYAIMSVNGNVDLSTSDELSDRLKDLSTRYEHVGVDLSNVPFMNTGGYSALLRVHKSLAAKNGEVALISLQSNIFDKLETLGFTEIFKVYDSIDAYVASMK